MFQPFANYNLGSGYRRREPGSLGEADETWTAPLMFSVSKVTLLGKRPVSFAVVARPTLANADGNASWRFVYRRRFCSGGSRAA